MIVLADIFPVFRCAAYGLQKVTAMLRMEYNKQMERTTRLELAHRDGVPSGIEDLRATLTLRPLTPERILSNYG